jgi:diacylglycerol kinase family enzyme
MNPSQRQLSRYGWRPADPLRRPVLFVNPRSGDGKAARAGLAERAREQGIEVVILTPGQDLAALAGEAAAGGADALGMAGGDGSLAVVAAVAAAHGIPFVCVAAGTRNQLGIVVLDAPGDSPRPPGRAWSAPRLQVSAPALVHAGVDGEAADLDPPLRFASRPAALRVRISPRHPGASPSARLGRPGRPD